MTHRLHLGYLPGCIGRIVDLHADCCSKDNDFELPLVVEER
jgi:hypothetical protein